MVAMRMRRGRQRLDRARTVPVRRCRGPRLEVFRLREILSDQRGADYVSVSLNQAAVGLTTLAMFAAALAMFYGAWHGDS